MKKDWRLPTELVSEQMQFATFSEHGQANQSPHDFANHVNISCHGNIDLPPGRVVKSKLMAVLFTPFSTATTCNV